MTSLINTVASLGSLLVLFLSLFVLLAIETKGSFHEKTKVFVSKNISFLGLFITGGAVLISLLYSTLLDYPPCTLCWWARILLYPNFVVFIMLLCKKYDRKTLLDFSIITSMLGILVSGFHTFITYTGKSFIACDAAVSCTQRFVYEFGFVTIPLMALISFTAVLTITFYAKKSIPKN